MSTELQQSSKRAKISFISEGEEKLTFSVTPGSLVIEGSKPEADERSNFLMLHYIKRRRTN